MNFKNLTTNQKWLVGLLAAAVVLCGVFSLTAASFQMGRMSSGARAGYVVQGRQYQNDQVVPQAPAAPQAPVAPAAPQPGMRGNRGFGPMQPGGMGFGIFGIIGGFFRLIFTIAFIMFIFFLVRRFVFGRRGWGPWAWRGGPGAWNQGVPPHFEEWHRRMHEQPAPAAPASDAPAAATGSDKPGDVTPTGNTGSANPTGDEGKLV